MRQDSDVKALTRLIAKDLFMIADESRKGNAIPEAIIEADGALYHVKLQASMSRSAIYRGAQIIAQEALTRHALVREGQPYSGPIEA